MLGAPTWYFSLIRKYVVLFGTLFNDIHVPRYNPNGSLDQLIAVPLLVGDKDKTLARVFADPDAARPSAITLPRMSFQMVGMKYAQERKLNSVENYTVKSSANNSLYLQQFNPVPYDLAFDLFIYANEYEDGTKIVEQILPFFTPEFVVRAILIPDMQNLAMNIPVVLQGEPTVEDNFAQGNVWDRRAVIWTLHFVVKAYLYGPIHDIGLIKFVEINSWIPQDGVQDHQENANNSGEYMRVTLQPGELSNGQPTTNAAASIPYTKINLGDNWGYAFIQTDFTNPTANLISNTPPPQNPR